MDGPTFTAPILGRALFKDAAKGHEPGANNHTKKFPPVEESDVYTGVPPKTKWGTGVVNESETHWTGENHIPDVAYVAPKYLLRA